MTHPNHHHTEELMTPDQVAELLHIPKSTLYYWRHQRRGLNAVRVGRHLRYRRTDVDNFLDCNHDR